MGCMSSDIASAPAEVDFATIASIVEPASAAELSAALTEVERDDLHALICGGRTRLAFGNLGGPFDLVISTARLNRVIQYDPDDLTLAVEPGCTLVQIEQLLGAQGQQIALDAPHPDRATIGGSYATGLSSPRRLSGGSLKDWVIGVEVAGSDG